MKTLTINIPDKKSTLVKQILIGLGVTIQPDTPADPSAYKKKLAKVSVWSDDDIKSLEDGQKAFENLKAQQW